MKPRLHYHPNTQHSRRVRIAAFELGVELDLVLVDFSKGAEREPGYLARNPNAKVPTLELEGFWLWESHAIMAYLADLGPETPFYPRDPRARADVHRWLFWESAHFGAACARMTWERMIKPMMGQQPDPAIIADGEAGFRRFGTVLDAQLEGREYVTGALTLADVALATALMWRGPAQIDVSPFRHLQAWLTRLEARDSWKRTAPDV